MSYHDDPDAERRPLLPATDYSHDDVHDQFCQLIGVPPSDLPQGRRWSPANRSLYSRAIRQRTKQTLEYRMTAATANFLLLAQVVIGAAVTGLGASRAENIHIVVTLLGAANTIIAGVVAYLKSRGQPMRARMFRDDLERVVDEIENSEVMWLGISKNVNGYDDIDTEDQVTVRSEVARLTRLYDKAVRNNALNNPDMYGSGDHSGLTSAALRNRTLPAGGTAAVVMPQDPTPAAAGGPPAGPAEPSEPAEGTQPTPLAADPEDSPATAKPTPATAVKVVVIPDQDDKKDEGTNNGNAQKAGEGAKDDKAAVGPNGDNVKGAGKDVADAADKDKAPEQSPKDEPKADAESPATNKKDDEASSKPAETGPSS